MSRCAVCDHRSDTGVLTHVGCFNCGAHPWEACVTTPPVTPRST